MQAPSAEHVLSRLRELGLPSAQAEKIEARLAKNVRVSERAALVRHRRNEVYRLSREGQSVRQIAETIGLSPDYVVQLRAALGVGRKR